MRIVRLLIGSAALSAAVPACAAALLDANYAADLRTGGVIVASRLTLAQSFTVQRTGLLSSAQLDLYYNGTPNADLTLQVRRMVGGKPAEASAGVDVLASASLAYTSLSTVVSSVNFDFADFAVSAGDQLALVLQSSTNAGEYVWRGDLGWPQNGYRNGTYAGGQGFSKGSSSPNPNAFGAASFCSLSCNDPSKVDFSFRTFVTEDVAAVPEPASWLTMVVGFGAIGWATRRRKVAVIFA